MTEPIGITDFLNIPFRVILASEDDAQQTSILDTFKDLPIVVETASTETELELKVLSPFHLIISRTHFLQKSLTEYLSNISRMYPEPHLILICDECSLSDISEVVKMIHLKEILSSKHLAKLATIIMQLQKEFHSRRIIHFADYVLSEEILSESLLLQAIQEKLTSENFQFGASQPSTQASSQKRFVRNRSSLSASTVQDTVKLLREQLRKRNFQEFAPRQELQILFDTFQKDTSKKSWLNALNQEKKISTIFVRLGQLFMQGNEKDSLDEVISTVGQSNLLKIVHICHLFYFTRHDSEPYANWMHKIWENSLATAYISEQIAEKIHYQTPTEMFMYGLLINIGEPFILKLLSEFPEIIHNDHSHIEIVADKYHPDFGAALLKSFQWYLPLVLMCGSHHKDAKDLKKLNTLISNADSILFGIHLINVANALADELGYQYFHPKNTPNRKLPEITESMTVVNASEEILESVSADVKNFVSKVSQIMQSIA